MEFLSIFSRQAYGNSFARECLDMALATAAFGQAITLVFIDEGVLQLAQEHDTDVSDKKPHSGVINALPLYDIDQIFYLQEDAHHWGLTVAELPEHAVAISTDKYRALINNAQCVQSF